MKALILFIFLSGCAHRAPTGSPREGKSTYSYTDISGNYRLVREFKTVKTKLVTRNQLMSSASKDGKVVEKSVLVSKLGTIKGKKSRLLVMRPEASEFTVWLEGKKYFSKMRINPEKHSMMVNLSSPESRWNGQSEVPFPKGRYFCFFNQIPECLYHNHLLQRAFETQSRPVDFFIVWDSFPFIQDQLTDVGKNLFAPATVKFEGEIKGNFRYIVEVGGQVILYVFSPSNDFLKMSWIVQGITIVPPGEEVGNDLN